MAELKQRRRPTTRPTGASTPTAGKDDPQGKNKNKGEKGAKAEAARGSNARGPLLHELHEEWKWAGREAHEMFFPIFDLILPGFSSLKEEDKEKHPFVKLNPLYYAAWVPTLLMLAAGKYLHEIMFDQGQPVRDDEKPAEKEARVAWIYMNDATYAFSALLDIWQLATDVAFWHFHGAFGCLLGLVLYIAIILGNAAFFEAMRARSSIRVRQAIVANAGFAVVLCGALVVVGLKKGYAILRWSWFMRAVAVFFQALSLLTYVHLWNLYPTATKEGGGSAIPVGATAVPGVLVIALTSIAFAVDAPAVWEALG